MKVLPVGIVLCLVSVHAFAAGNSSLYTSLTDLNQNQAFRPKLLAAPASSFKLAKVHFVVDTADKIGFDDIEQSFDHKNAQRCKDLGFAQTAACAANQFKARLCPYDDAYYDRCCDNDYKYTKGECSYPNTISSTSCGGKYKCYCDTALYPYTPPIVPLPRSFPTNASMLPALIMPNANAPLITNPVTPPRTLSGSVKPVRASAKPSMPPATASRDTNMSVRNSGRPIRMTFVRTASNITKAARPAGITVI